MILTILKSIMGLFSNTQSLGKINGTLAVVVIGGGVLWKLQEVGTDYCFSVFELVGIGAVMLMFLEFNRRAGPPK